MGARHLRLVQSGGAAGVAARPACTVLTARAALQTSLADNPAMEPVCDVDSVPASRRSLVCSLCKQRGGACVRCSQPRCFAGMHALCAHEAGLTGVRAAPGLAELCATHMLTRCCGPPQSSAAAPFAVYCPKHLGAAPALPWHAHAYPTAGLFMHAPPDEPLMLADAAGGVSGAAAPVATGSDGVAGTGEAHGLQPPTEQWLHAGELAAPDGPPSGGYCLCHSSEGGLYMQVRSARTCAWAGGALARALTPLPHCALPRSAWLAPVAAMAGCTPSVSACRQSV